MESNELSETFAEHAHSQSIRTALGEWVFTLSRDPWNHLQLVDALGSIYRDVAVIPLFPVSGNEEWVSIVSGDGEELACLRDLGKLSESNRNLINEELAYREFVPQILRVISVSGTQEPCEWTVETNFGETKFVLNSEEDVRRVSTWSVTFADANGGRFRVDDLRRLDSRSRSFVDWYV